MYTHTSLFIYIPLRLRVRARAIFPRQRVWLIIFGRWWAGSQRLSPVPKTLIYIRSQCFGLNCARARVCVKTATMAAAASSCVCVCVSSCHHHMVVFSSALKRFLVLDPISLFDTAAATPRDDPPPPTPHTRKCARMSHIYSVCVCLCVRVSATHTQTLLSTFIY